MQWRNSTAVVQVWDGLAQPTRLHVIPHSSKQGTKLRDVLTARKGVPPPPVFPSNYQRAVSCSRLLRGDGDTHLSAWLSAHPMVVIHLS